MNLSYASHKHVLEIALALKISEDEALEIIINYHLLLSSMSFKDRNKIKRLILKYNGVQQ